MSGKKSTGKPKSKRIKCPFCGKIFTATRKKQKYINRLKKREGVESYQVRGVIFGNNRVKCVDCGKTITFGRDAYFKENKGHKNIM